jgi:post-segregation antitoxin (ccd killing protein)
MPPLHSEDLRRELGKDRVQVQLTKSQIAALRARARRRGVSVSSLVREAVDESLKRDEELSRDELWARAREAIGKYRSGLSDLAENHDKYFGEEHG